MKPISGSGPIDAAEPTPADGSILRGVPVHVDARRLPGRRAEARPRPARAAGDLRDRFDTTENPPDAATFGVPVDGAGLYDQGYRDGRAEAAAGIDEARRRAEEAGFEAGRVEGHAAGLDAGLDAGRDEGRLESEQRARAGQEQIAARLRLLEQLLSSARDEVGARIASAEDDMIALCHAAICRILGEQLVTREGVAHALRTALREAAKGQAGGAPLEVRVNPGDLDLLRGDAEVAAWVSRAATRAGTEVRWLPDDEIGSGGCLIDFPDGTFDARLETQLSSLRALLQTSRAPPGEPE